MAKFYFNVIGSINATDDTGANLDHAVAAAQHAAEVAEEVAHNSNARFVGNAIQIIDEAGNEVCRVRIDGVVHHR